jgi:hypothetical protein
MADWLFALIVKYYLKTTKPKETPMSIISIEEQIRLLQNLLSDPDDWVSSEILRLNRENETEAAKRSRGEASEPIGANEIKIGSEKSDQ